MAQLAPCNPHNRSKSIALFDLELDEADGCNFTASDVLRELLSECAVSHDQAKLSNDAQQAHVLALSPSGELNLERFAQLLAMRGHHVWLRTGRLDCGLAGHVALRHTFVLAGVTGNSGADLMPELFVVDPCFKEQFQLSNATPEYSALWQDLPNLFVGTAEQLVPVVELLCTQMKKVFADTSSSCPPWRTPSCMLTKWLPSTADDVPVTAPGSSYGDSSSQPSSSGTNSALSSPAALRHPSASTVGLLAPIRTAGGPAGEVPAGITPHSARSPLYFDHDVSSSKAFLGFGSPEAEFVGAAAAQYHSDSEAADPRDSIFVHWGADSNAAANPVANGRGLGEAGFMGSGSWGFGALASTVSSSGCDVIWGSLRNCRSEDGTGPLPESRSVAIASRTKSRVDQGGNGFAEALVGRTALAQLRELSPDVGGLPPRSVSATTPSVTAGQGHGQQGLRSSSAFFGAYRSHLVAGNPTLDISRFDNSSYDDVPAGPPGWGGLGAELRGSSTSSSIASGRKLSGSSSSGKPAGGGAMCPPAVRRRSSSNSSQCSALSAAIAGKGVAMRG